MVQKILGRLRKGIEMSVDNSECKLQIGDICCSLRLNDPALVSFLNRYYEGFLTDADPALTVDINIVSKGENTPLPNSILMSKTVEGRNFNFHSGLITGTLDIDGKQCTIAVKEALFKCIRIFEHFLFQTYYTLIKNNHTAKSSGNFLAHGCSISRDGSGFLFTGPSESGKSTIAEISSDLTVLGDEIALIKNENGGYRVSATPFRGDFRENKNETAPLDAIFLIKHGKTNNIRKISKLEFVTRFVREVIYPGTLLSADRKEDFSEMIEFCTEIADKVPFYELSFLPDKGFWKNINDMELNIEKQGGK
jgi:hypothetical protein